MKITKKLLREMVEEEIQKILERDDNQIAVDAGILIKRNGSYYVNPKAKTLIDTNVEPVMRHRNQITLKASPDMSVYEFSFLGIRGYGPTIEKAIDDCFKPGWFEPIKARLIN